MTFSNVRRQACAVRTGMWLTVLMTVLSVTARAADAQVIENDVPQRGIFSLQPAPRWQEALLIGNGKMGGLVMSQPFDETIILTHERLFLPLREETPTVETASRLGELRQLTRDGKFGEAAKLVMTIDVEQGRPGKMVWTSPFFPACDLRVTLENKVKPSVYRRSLDYETGIARVQYADDGTHYQQRSFISRADNVVVLELTADGAKKLQGTIAITQHQSDKRDVDDGEKNALSKAPEITLTAEGQGLAYRAAYRRGGGGYDVVAHVVATGAKAEAKSGAIHVDGASKVVVLLRIVPLAEFKNSAVEQTMKELKALGGDFDAMLKRHVALHGAIYGREKLDLGGAAARHVAAEQLWEQTHAKPVTPALLEQVFDAGRYEILCSCGDWPPNLQGIWTGVWDTPWCSDYTLNGNVASAIANILNGNMPELMNSLFDYFDLLMDHFRSNAKRLYNARGIAIPSRTSLSGYNLSYNQRYCMTFWTAGAAWYAGFYYDYYLYTGDKEFLRKRALPYMKEAALFYEDFMVKDAKGVYEFNPSYSPENAPKGSEVQAAINATMDLAACRQVLGNLIKICTELGLEKESVVKWKVMMEALPKYMIGDEGELKEWCSPMMKENQEHRHCSHFLGLWYGVDPAIAGDPALLAAAKKAVLLRADFREKNKAKGVMGFGEVQVGLAAASLKDASTAWGCVERMATGYYYPTFASSHDAGPKLFNADISGGLPAVMIEMLVASQPGSITLLPAWPDQFPGRIFGVPCRGQVTIDELKWSPDRVDFTLRSAKDQDVAITCMRGGKLYKAKLELKANVPVFRQFFAK